MIFFRQVDCGGCAPCPTGPCEPSTPASPTTEARTASASLSKCGWDEWPGYESTPPKIYLTRTLSGALKYTNYSAGSGCDPCINYIEDSFSGSTTTDSLTCNQSGTMYYTRDTSDDCVTITTSTTAQTSDIFALVTVGVSESFTSITHTISGDGVCYNDSDTTGSASAVNSSEYTTATLLSNVASSIPAFSGAYHSYNPANDYAYYDLSTDEITATETKLQYRFALPDLTGYTCYKITWAEKFVPESGSTVYTSLSYTWDGSATYAGPYTIDPPASQGTTTVVSVSVTCSGC